MYKVIHLLLSLLIVLLFVAAIITGFQFTAIGLLQSVLDEAVLLGPFANQTLIQIANDFTAIFQRMGAASVFMIMVWLFLCNFIFKVDDPLSVRKYRIVWLSFFVPVSGAPWGIFISSIWQIQTMMPGTKQLFGFVAAVIAVLVFWIFTALLTRETVRPAVPGYRLFPADLFGGWLK